MRYKCSSQVVGFAVLGLFVACFPTLAAALEGETADAIIQSVDEADDTDSTSKFTVTVKLKKAGQYVIAAGYVKKGRMHKGSVYGTKYYGTAFVKGDAGDQITTTIRRVPSPPLNNIYGAGAYNTENDIKTGG